MLPDQMITNSEACDLPPADPDRPVTVDRIRNAREEGLLPGSRQDQGGRRAWRYRVGDLVAAGFVSAAVHAGADGATADLRAIVERQGSELAELRADYRLVRELLTRLMTAGDV